MYIHASRVCVMCFELRTSLKDNILQFLFRSYVCTYIPKSLLTIEMLTDTDLLVYAALPSASAVDTALKDIHTHIYSKLYEMMLSCIPPTCMA